MVTVQRGHSPTPPFPPVRSMSVDDAESEMRRVRAAEYPLKRLLVKDVLECWIVQFVGHDGTELFSKSRDLDKGEGRLMRRHLEIL